MPTVLYACWNIYSVILKYIKVVQLEGTFGDYVVQLPELYRANQKLKHINEVIIQLPLEHWQAWAISLLSRKPIQMFDHPHSMEIFPKEFFPNSVGMYKSNDNTGVHIDSNIK